MGPLAEQIWANQEPSLGDLKSFVLNGKTENNPEELLAGARDIVAERLNEMASVRERLRARYVKEGVLCVAQTRGAPAGHLFSEHVGKTERLGTMPGHRLLAVLRGEGEKCLTLSVEVDLESARADVLDSAFPRGTRPSPSLDLAVRDSVKRLLGPSLESEVLREARGQAERGAIQVFAENLRQLLLAAPLDRSLCWLLIPACGPGAKWCSCRARGPCWTTL